MKGVIFVKYTEGEKLKSGDLVVMTNKKYNGLILEIESIDRRDGTNYFDITLKQPGFNGVFRISKCGLTNLERYRV